MNSKGMKTIALLLAAVFLIGGSVAGMVVAGSENRSDDQEFTTDALYWWEEQLCLTPYQRTQVRDIMVLIFGRYFGIDISRMTSDELDELGALIGNERKEKLPTLFEHYAQKQGFEIPEPPEPPAPLPVEDVYWWEIAPKEYAEVIIEQIAEAKGMSAEEAKERFEELFPGVDLWKMAFDEFNLFLNSLPRPPVRPVCLEEAKGDPSVIAVFGRIPTLATEREIKEFDAKLSAVIDKARPLLTNLITDASIAAWRGYISIAVPGDHIPAAEQIYAVISEKAKSLFGIEDVPAIFSGGTRGIRLLGGAPPSLPTSIGHPSSLAPSSWRAPFNEPFAVLPGGVKKTARDPAWTWSASSTISFAHRWFIWWRLWDLWDEDYIVTGHLSGITPIDTLIYQPTIGPGHEAGRVVATVGHRTRADAARVGIADARVRPYILMGGTASSPVFRSVVAAADAPVGATIWITGASSGLTFSGTIVKHRNVPGVPPFEMNYNQVLVRPTTHWPIVGDSGAPVWDTPAAGQARIRGVLWGTWRYRDELFIVFSPISGVIHELGGEVWLK